MKTITWILVAALLLALSGMPAAVGFIAQNRLIAQVDQAEENYWLDAKMVDYRRGWFDSVATVEFGLSAAYQDQIEKALEENASEGEPLTADQQAATAALREAFAARIVLETRVDHGPVIFGDGFHFGLATATTRLVQQPDQVTEFLARANIPYLFEIRANTGFSGMTQFDADVPAFEYPYEQGKLVFSGLDMLGEYDPGTLRVQFHGGTDSTIAEFETGMLSLSDMTFTGDLTALSRYVAIGSMEFKVGRMLVTNQGDEDSVAFEMRDAGFSSQTDLSGDGSSLDASVTYFVGSSTAGNDASLTDAIVVVSVRDVDVAAMEAYGEIVQTAGMAEEIFSEKGLSRLQPVVYDILASSPSIEFAPVRLWWNDQPFEAQVLVEFDKDRLPEKESFSFMDQDMWLGIMSVSSSIEAAEDLVRPVAVSVLKKQLVAGMQEGDGVTAEQLDAMASMQVEMTLAALVQQGLINKSETGYLSRIVFADGMLTINENPVPIGVTQ